MLTVVHVRLSSYEMGDRARTLPVHEDLEILDATVCAKYFAQMTFIDISRELFYDNLLPSVRCPSITGVFSTFVLFGTGERLKLGE